MPSDERECPVQPFDLHPYTDSAPTLATPYRAAQTRCRTLVLSERYTIARVILTPVEFVITVSPFASLRF